MAFDFHHIDQDVLLPELRKFGKGPSPKKKVCYTSFCPRLAWDVQNGTLLVAEFRKASARGPVLVAKMAAVFLSSAFM